MDMHQLKMKFIEEAQSLLTNLDNVLIDLEKTNDSQSVNEVFRVMHTIKGASGMFGFDKIVEITHEAEGIYDLVRNGQLKISQELIEVTFSTADHIRALLSDENFLDDNNQKRHEILKSTIQNIKGIKTENKAIDIKTEEKNETQSLRTWHILFVPSEELIKRCVNIIYTMQDLFALGEYKISNYSPNPKELEFWHIFLVTESSYDDIENALLFIMDYCKITEIAKFNIFDSKLLANRDGELSGDSRRIDSLVNYTRDLLPPGKIETPANVISQLLNDNTIPVQNQVKTVSTRINVEVAKLDSLMYLVSELVTSKSELLNGIQKHDEGKIFSAAEKIDKLSKLFSDNALDIRLVSLNEMLDKFKRLIRDLAKHLGKSIDFVIEGEDTELDKSIIDAIGEPIMHLIRNNIDHGIESLKHDFPWENLKPV
jgi:two-component system chemotaxis sensor kinase CheA